MKSTLKVAALAALCNYASAKEIEIDAEKDASLYASGIMHEKIMHTKEVRGLSSPSSLSEKEELLTRKVIDLLG